MTGNAGPIADIPEILRDVSDGRMVIIVDDEARENEGDLFIPASCVTPAAINFMATHGRGLVCMPVTNALADLLALPPMTAENETANQTAFTLSIGARYGTTTGISAHDRALTIRTAVRAGACAADLVRPGHVFPLRARDGGVLERAGHTEAAVDLARMAGLTPAGVICEIMNDDGTMARMPDLQIFAAHHGLKIATIADLIAWRKKTEVSKVA